MAASEIHPEVHDFLSPASTDQVMSNRISSCFHSTKGLDATQSTMSDPVGIGKPRSLRVFYFLNLIMAAAHRGSRDKHSHVCSIFASSSGVRKTLVDYLAATPARISPVAVGLVRRGPYPQELEGRRAGSGWSVLESFPRNRNIILEPLRCAALASSMIHCQSKHETIP